MALGRLLGPLALGGAAGIAGATGWTIAERLLEAPGPQHDDVLDTDPVVVTGVGDGTVDLSGDEAARPGTWGLSWARGYGQVTSVLRDDGDTVRRTYHPIVGTPAARTPARLDMDAYPGDPGVLGLPYQEVTYRSPLGEPPAWAFPADGGSGTWAVLVHGRAGTRTQTLRLVPTLHRLGISSLAIAYRNDPDAPRTPDGHCHLGASEWQDVEGAVVYALAHGATDIVLVGYSMGGTAALAFLRTSPHAAHVRATILDAPVLSWPRLVHSAALREGLPSPVARVAVPAALALARLRAGIDRSLIDHLDHAADLHRPILLIHGDADDHVPIATSEELATRRPDVVTFVPIAGATHLASWNVDRATVESSVERFLLDVRDAGTGTVADRARVAVRRGLARVRSATGR